MGVLARVDEPSSSRKDLKRKAACSSGKGQQQEPKAKQFRSNLLATSRIFAELKPNIRVEHRNCMLLTPFAHFWNAFLDGNVVQSRVSKSDQLICSIISTYSPEDNGFKIGGEVLKLTVRDFELIFGITSGSVKVNEKGIKKRDTEFLKRRKVYNKTHSLRVKDISEELPILVLGNTETEVKDFIKLLCLHTMCTVFDSTSGSSIPFWLIEKVDDLDNLRSFAWNVHFTNKLQKSLSHSYTNPTLVIGCVTFIAVRPL